MLTIEEVKKALDAGETVELECIDREGYEGEHRLNCTLLKTARLIAQEVDYCKVIIKNTDASTQITGIDRDELKYFRIKRPTPTFDDLIDIAAKAVKDGVIFSAEIFESAIYIYLDSSAYDFCKSSLSIINDLDSDMKRIPEVIDKINSLYAETFVIEHASDIENIKENAVIRLQNGNEVCAESNCLHHHVNFIQTTYGGNNFHLSFISLKGATVTQKRGAA